MTISHQRLAAIEFLKAHPEYQSYGAKLLAKLDNAPRVGLKTWQRAREALSLPPAPRSNRHATKTRKQERKAAFAIYPNTYKIVVDTQHLKVIFHGEGGFKIAQKTSKKALAASLRLFRLAKFVTREHDTENGIMVLTFEHQSQAVAA